MKWYSVLLENLVESTDSYNNFTFLMVSGKFVIIHRSGYLPNANVHALKNAYNMYNVWDDFVCYTEIYSRKTGLKNYLDGEWD